MSRTNIRSLIKSVQDTSTLGKRETGMRVRTIASDGWAADLNITEGPYRLKVDALLVVDGIHSNWTRDWTLPANRLPGQKFRPPDLLE
jgi:hypothetical protein